MSPAEWGHLKAVEQSKHFSVWGSDDIVQGTEEKKREENSDSSNKRRNTKGHDQIGGGP